MGAELSQKPIAVANSSGFPLQIATINTVNQSTNWRVLLEEHPWKSDLTGSDGFIDIVAVTQHNGTFAMVIECKRVRQAAWVFLVPQLSSTERKQTKIWDSYLRDSKWEKYGWTDWPTDPSSYVSKYCAIPGQEQGRRNLLERTASELIDSLEALAHQERLLQEQFGSDNFARVYIPVIVTTANLFVSHFDPASISLIDGYLPADTSIRPVQVIRFKKSLTANAQSLLRGSIEDLNIKSDRTIFVVNAVYLKNFLIDFEPE